MGPSQVPHMFAFVYTNVRHICILSFILLYTYITRLYYVPHKLPHFFSNRFELISRNLHFSNNKSAKAKKDKAWKVRSVVEVLQQTFQWGWVLGYEMAFDEGIIPSKSRMNKLRQYLKDKPHKWGTKVFLLCCSRTGYCAR